MSKLGRSDELGVMNYMLQFNVHSRRYATIWLMVSVIWLYVGIRMITRHEGFGWFLCVFYLFLAFYYMYRFFKTASEARSDNAPERTNGQ
jgi:hypothetical protein